MKTRENNEGVWVPLTLVVASAVILGCKVLHLPDRVAFIPFVGWWLWLAWYAKKTGWRKSTL